MKRFIYIVLGFSFIILMSFVFGINSINDIELREILIGGKFNGLINLSLSFWAIFILLRLRDYLLNTKFPINLINSNPIASSIYYSVSIFSFCYVITTAFN